MRQTIRAFIAGAAILGALTGGAATVSAAPAHPQRTSSPSLPTDSPVAQADQFLRLLNQTRMDHGLGVLQRDSGLDDVAAQWAAHMKIVWNRVRATDPTMGVVDPAAPTDCERSALCHRHDLGPVSERVEPRWRGAGENLGTGGSVVSLHDAFFASLGHRANMLGSFNRVGISVVIDSDRLWVAFNFLLGPSLPEPTQARGAIPVQGWHAPTEVLAAGPPSAYEPVEPRRVLDTRSSAALAANTEFEIDFSDETERPNDATGAVVNMTVTEPAGSGFVTVYPCGSPTPNASNVNFKRGQTVPNLVSVALGAGSRVCVTASTSVHLVVDIAGWLTPKAKLAMFNRAPYRVEDTRWQGRKARLIAVRFAGRVPDKTSAVSLNITVTEPDGPGFLTAYPCRNRVAPLASNLNFAAGETKPNMAVVPIDENGLVCFYSSVNAHIVIDLTGSFAPGADLLQPVVPARLLDTRSGVGGWLGRLISGQSIALDMHQFPGISKLSDGMLANVTVADPAAAGYLTVYPCDEGRPVASNLNYVAGETKANLVGIDVPTSGNVCLYSSQDTNVIVDVSALVTPRR